MAEHESCWHGVVGACEHGFLSWGQSVQEAAAVVSWATWLTAKCRAWAPLCVRVGGQCVCLGRVGLGMVVVVVVVVGVCVMVIVVVTSSLLLLS